MKLQLKFIVCLAALVLSSNSYTDVYKAEGIEGSAERGRLAFASCRTCHYPEKIVGHNNGPNLNNIFAKEIGKQPGFEYSVSMQAMDVKWTPLLLDIFLQNPALFIPGNMMMQLPISDAQRRADIIEYLKTFED